MTKRTGEGAHAVNLVVGVVGAGGLALSAWFARSASVEVASLNAQVQREISVQHELREGEARQARADLERERQQRAVESDLFKSFQPLLTARADPCAATKMLATIGRAQLFRKEWLDALDGLSNINCAVKDQAFVQVRVTQARALVCTDTRATHETDDLIAHALLGAGDELARASAAAEHQCASKFDAQPLPVARSAAYADGSVSFYSGEKVIWPNPRAQGIALWCNCHPITPCGAPKNWSCEPNGSISRTIRWSATSKIEIEIPAGARACTASAKFETYTRGGGRPTSCADTAKMIQGGAPQVTADPDPPWPDAYKDNEGGCTFTVYCDYPMKP